MDYEKDIKASEESITVQTTKNSKDCIFIDPGTSCTSNTTFGKIENTKLWGKEKFGTFSSEKVNKTPWGYSMVEDKELKRRWLLKNIINNIKGVNNG